MAPVVGHCPSKWQGKAGIVPSFPRKTPGEGVDCESDRSCARCGVKPEGESVMTERVGVERSQSSRIDTSLSTVGERYG